MVTATEKWAQDLADWAIPEALLDAVSWNPYEWSPALFARRDQTREQGDLPPRHTVEVVERFSPSSVLDIGAGAGGSCFDLAGPGRSLTAVERDSGMVAKLRAEAERRALAVTVVEGGWPEVADQVQSADVVTCSHVIHNVPDIAPFLVAMAEKASKAIVIQEFERHPWAHLGPYYDALHGLARPTGPTVDQLAEVVTEVFGMSPTVERWLGGRPMWFVDRAELLDFYGRRLVVPMERWDELEAVLEPEIIELGDGRVQLEDRQKQLATVWWSV